MNKLNLIIILLIGFTFHSCSEDENEIEENQNPSEIIDRFISEIDYSNNQSNDKLVYENNKLHQVFQYCCEVTNSNGTFSQGNLYQFDYNANGKISAIYVDEILYTGNYPDFSSQDIAIEANKQFDYIYNSQNQLIELSPANNQYKQLFFEYTNNKMTKVNRYSLQNGNFVWTSTMNISYNTDDNVSQTSLTYLSSGFTYNQYFTYDNKQNPFQVLNNNFGLVDFFFNWNGFDYSNVNLQFYLSKNNVLETSNDDGLQDTVSYEYNNNYPTAIQFEIDNNTNNQYLTYTE